MLIMFIKKLAFRLIVKRDCQFEIFLFKSRQPNLTENLNK